MALCSGYSSDMDKDEAHSASPTTTTNSTSSPHGRRCPPPPPSAPTPSPVDRISYGSQFTPINGRKSTRLYTTTIKFPTSHKSQQEGSHHPQLLKTTSTSATYPARSNSLEDTEPKFRLKEEDPNDLIDLTGLDDDLIESDVNNSPPRHSETDSVLPLTPSKKQRTKPQRQSVVSSEPWTRYTSQFQVSSPCTPIEIHRSPAHSPSSIASYSPPPAPAPSPPRLEHILHPETLWSSRVEPPSSEPNPSTDHFLYLKAKYHQLRQPERDTKLPTTATPTISACACPIKSRFIRPDNSWINFRAAHYISSKQIYPSLPEEDIARHVSILWNCASENEQLRWKTVTEKDSEQHNTSKSELPPLEGEPPDFCELCGRPRSATETMSGGRLQTAAERGNAPSLNDEQQFRKQPPTFAVKMPGQMPLTPAMIRKGELAYAQQSARSYSDLPTPGRLSLQAAPAQRPPASGPAHAVAEFRRVTQTRRADSRGDIVQQTAHVRGPSDALPYAIASFAPESPLRPRSLWEHQQLAQLPRDATPMEISKALQQMREVYGTAGRQSVAQQYTPGPARLPPATPRYAVQPNSARMQPPATPIASTPATGRALRPELIQPMEISALQRIKSIAKIAGPRGLSCEDSLQRMRGVVIAIEGTDIQAVNLMARFLHTRFSDTSRYAVMEWTPGFAEKLIAHAQPQIKDMRRMIDLWDEAGDEILSFFEDPLRDNEAETANARKRKSKALDDMDEDSSPVLPIAILTQYMLTMTDVASTTISPGDKYIPIEHYQWLASQWRGMIGPDITIYIDSPEDMPSRRASEADEMRAAAVTLEGMHDESMEEKDHKKPESTSTFSHSDALTTPRRSSVNLPSLQTVLDENAKEDLSPHLPPLAVDKDKDKDAMDEDPAPSSMEASSPIRTRTKSTFASQLRGDATVETRIEDARSVVLHLTRPHAVPERELHRVAFEIEDWARGKLGRLGW